MKKLTHGYVTIGKIMEYIREGNKLVRYETYPINQSKHSVFSPSSLFRRIGCPASLKEEIKYPDTENSYAKLGNIAHNFAEGILRFKYESNNQGIIVNIDEMAKHVGEYCDYIDGLLDKDKFILIEQTVDLSHVLPNVDRYKDKLSGTADCIIWNKKNKHLHIVDLKYGKGKVEVENNHQLRTYALGAIKLLDVKYNKKVDLVSTHIYQPRINYIGETSYTIEELNSYKLDLFKNLLLCLEDKPKYNPTYDNCRFCKAKEHCKERLDQMNIDYSNYLDEVMK